MIIQAIKSVISDKIKTVSMNQLMFEIDKLLIFAGILALLIDRSVVDFVFEYKNAIILKSMIVLNAYVFFDMVVIWICGAWQYIPRIQRRFDDHIGEAVAMVDDQSIASSILKRNGFPYILAKQELKMTAKDHKRIGDKLEEFGILIRSEKNARILSHDIDIEKLSKAIKKIQSNDDTPLLVKTESGYDVENYGKLGAN